MTHNPDGSWTFKVMHNEELHKGQFRRILNHRLDTIDWQYRAWFGGKWETYFSLTMEHVHYVPKSRNHINSMMCNKAAHAALQEKRFYKVERVDSPT